MPLVTKPAHLLRFNRNRQPYTQNRENRRCSTCGFLFSILGMVADALPNVVDGPVSWRPGWKCMWRLGLGTRLRKHLLGMR